MPRRRVDPRDEVARIFLLPHTEHPLGVSATRRLPRRLGTMMAMNLTRAALACTLLVSCRAAPQPSLRLGTTYTVQQSGALAVLESLWTTPPLTTVIGPSGQILRAAA